MGVKINGCDSDFFTTSTGLRHGDPLSPLLFNLVVDVLSKMLVKASARGLINGLCPAVCLGGIMCLQYEDDTILFLEKDPDKATNLKTVLSCFEHVSRMKVNYNKSELTP